MSLIQRFMTGEYTVMRSGPGQYVKGRYRRGEIETITVMGSLQPTTARELKLPEEGNRLRQYWQFFTDKPVVTDNTATLARGDQVVINGETYRAMSLTSWQGTDLDHYITVLWREPEQASDGKGAANQ